MVKAGLTETLIPWVVKTQPAKYDLSTDRLIGLTRAGVPDRRHQAVAPYGS